MQEQYYTGEHGEVKAQKDEYYTEEVDVAAAEKEEYAEENEEHGFEVQCQHGCQVNQQLGRLRHIVSLILHTERGVKLV